MPTTTRQKTRKRAPAPIEPEKLLAEARKNLGPAKRGRPDAFRMRRAASLAGRTGDSKINQYVLPVVKRLRETPIAEVASAFCDLQQARHRADYDHLRPVSRPTAAVSVDDAEKSIKALAEAKQTDREAYFALLALRARIPN